MGFVRPIFWSKFLLPLILAYNHVNILIIGLADQLVRVLVRVTIKLELRVPAHITFLV